jgi:LysR family carnitine catabolism transcriptional activator
MSVSYRRVKALIAVADNGSFTRAALALNTSQPALSAQVRELEASLGLPLLSRTTRSVQLTPEGEKFVMRAKRPIAELEKLFIETRDRVEVRRSQVSLSCVSMIASHLLPGVIADFTRRHAGVKLEVFEHNSAEAEQAVLDEVVEFAVCGRTTRTGEFDFRIIARDHFMVLALPDDPICRFETVTLEDLVDSNLILMRRGSNSRSTLDRATQAAGVVLNPTCEVTHHISVASMVDAGLGVGILPAITMQGLGRRDLASIAIKPEIHREVVILRKRASAPTIAASELVDALANAIPRKWRVFGKAI